MTESQIERTKKRIVQYRKSAIEQRILGRDEIADLFDDTANKLETTLHTKDRCYD